MKHSGTVSTFAVTLLGASAFALSAARFAPAATSASVSRPVTKKVVAKKVVVKKVVVKTKMMPLRLALPKPAYLGTPKNIKLGARIERPTGKPRPLVFVPIGTTNVASRKPVTSSDSDPIIGTLDLITDGDKAAGDGSWVSLGPGSQWVQIDLQQAYNLSYMVAWHFHGEARIYRDVIVQVADDAAFKTNIRTIFNNDFDNSSERGIGQNLEYFENAEGKLINARNIKARYVRFYSKGNTSDDQNDYTEIEIYGK